MLKRLDKKLFCLSLVVLALTFTGCSSAPKYIDPGDKDVVRLTFNPNDLQMIAETMANSLIQTDIFGGERPIVRITEVKNKTSEHVDTKAITDKIRTTLIKSRKVRFVRDKSEAFAEEDQMKEFREQMDPSGRGAMMDDKSKLKIGKIKGPKYHLFGEIISITASDDIGKDVYYKMTLSLMDLEQGLLEWAEEKELRKVQDRALFGR